MKRIYGYVKQYPKGAIRMRLGLPDYSDLPLEKYERTSIYGNIAEELPSDMPVPRGKLVITTTYEDAICTMTILQVGQLLAFYIWSIRPPSIGTVSNRLQLRWLRMDQSSMQREPLQIMDMWYTHM